MSAAVHDGRAADSSSARASAPKFRPATHWLLSWGIGSYRAETRCFGLIVLEALFSFKLGQKACQSLGPKAGVIYTWSLADRVGVLKSPNTKASRTGPALLYQNIPDKRDH